MRFKEPYSGTSRKLVLALDIGTTFSGVSYCILDPGEVPQVLVVAKYPAQEHVGGDYRIPSILYYDRLGAVTAVSAEALRQSIVERAEEEGWIKLEWWKLHLRAKHLTSSHIKDEDIPPLLPHLSADDVLADFMGCLFTCARNSIIESNYDGASMWKPLQTKIHFVLTHPNGWEGFQQRQIRFAAKIAGPIPEGDEHAKRIHLLTEGEANLHFCNDVLASDPIPNLPIVIEDPEEEVDEELEQQGVIIIDAGGGTIDLSAYFVNVSPRKEFKEIAPAESRLQGSVFVTQRAHASLKAKLANSPYGSPDSVLRMKELFDRTTKLGFRDASRPQYIWFGTVRDRDPEYDIKSGQIKLAGKDVAKFFEPSVEAIADAFEKQRKTAMKQQIKIKHAFLVGGYAASDFLYQSLQQHPVFSDVNLCRPQSPTNKAVADGALLSYINSLVTSRTSRFTYGFKRYTTYIAVLLDHQERESTKYDLPSGETVVPNAFLLILEMGVQVLEVEEFRFTFTRESRSRSALMTIKEPIFAYKGDLPCPRWVDKDPVCFTPVGTVTANTSELGWSLKEKEATNGGVYFRMKYDVILLFGLVELKAQISWMHEGVEKRSPASIVY